MATAASRAAASAMHRKNGPLPGGSSHTQKNSLTPLAPGVIDAAGAGARLRVAIVLRVLSVEDYRNG